MKTSTRHNTQKLSHPIHISKWVNSYEWDYYCTLTTRYSLSLYSARKAMERLHEYLKLCYPSIRIVWTVEPFDAKEGNHVHALINLTNGGFIDFEHGKSIVTQAWQVVTKLEKGKADTYCHIEEYDKSRGGSYYLAKYINREQADYDFFF